MNELKWNPFSSNLLTSQICGGHQYEVFTCSSESGQLVMIMCAFFRPVPTHAYAKRVGARKRNWPSRSAWYQRLNTFRYYHSTIIDEDETSSERETPFDEYQWARGNPREYSYNPIIGMLLGCAKISSLDVTIFTDCPIEAVPRCLSLIVTRLGLVGRVEGLSGHNRIFWFYLNQPMDTYVPNII